MRTKIKFKVSKEGIKNGVRRSANLCPIARALRFEGYINVNVAYEDISFEDRKRNLYTSGGTNKINKFIEDFDNGKNVVPGVFEVLCDVEEYKEDTTSYWCYHEN